MSLGYLTCSLWHLFDPCWSCLIALLTLNCLVSFDDGQLDLHFYFGCFCLYWAGNLLGAKLDIKIHEVKRTSAHDSCDFVPLYCSPGCLSAASSLASSTRHLRHPLDCSVFFTVITDYATGACGELLPHFL